MTGNTPIKFNVVIPTRERCDTLSSSLRTCVSQDYENLEIIVSDNFSQDQTKEVVNSFQDPRIRYFNTGRRLSMSHNWEFGLSQVRDGYVMILGDDDGLLPHSLRDLDQLIKQTGAKAVNWLPIKYGWPNCVDLSLRNKISIPVCKGFSWRNSRSILSRVLSFKLPNVDLPMLYGFFVDMDVVRAATAPSGQFFHSLIPDAYSGIAIASVLDRFLFSYQPFGFYGYSRHSTGTSFLNDRAGKLPIGNYLQEDNIPFHENLEIAPSMILLTAESFLQAKEVLTGLKDFEIDYEKLIFSVLQETYKMSPPEYAKVKEILVRISKKNNLGDDMFLRIQNYYPRLWNKIIFSYPLRRILNTAIFDTTENEIRNGYDASLFCAAVLKEYGNGKSFYRERIRSILYQLRVRKIIKG